MRKAKYLFILLLILASAFIFPETQPQKTLAELYAAGKIQLIPEIVIDDDSMGGDNFFEGVIDITCDDKGYVYVSDFKANNIKKFDSSGHFIKVIGREGQGPGEFSWPWEISVSKGRLFVWDMRNIRVCILTTDGEFIKAVKFKSYEGRPEKLIALPNGDVVIELEKVYFHEKERPQDRTINIYSSDLELKRTIYSQKVLRNKYMHIEGMFTNLPQPFPQMVHWDVSPEGKIVIGFSKDYEIEIFDSEKGKLSSFAHTYKPVKVTEEDKKMFFRGITFSSSNGKSKSGAPDFMIENTEFPKFKPPFNNLFVDSEGNILVHANKKKQSEAFRYFDAFKPKGEFIGVVHVLGKTTFLSQRSVNFIDKCVWMQETDEDGLIKIIKYRISE